MNLSLLLLYIRLKENLKEGMIKALMLVKERFKFKILNFGEVYMGFYV